MITSIELFESGDEYRRLRQRLVSYFHYRRCADPEDLADETIKRLLETYPREGELPGLGRWAFGIAQNVHREWLRAREWRNEPLTGAEEGRMSSSDDVEQQLLAADLLSGLASQDRDLLKERFFDGEDYRTLAERRGFTARWARVRVCRVLQGLSQQFAAEVR
jgi:RNA polymerase sigma factor (sigma-70 family)